MILSICGTRTSSTTFRIQDRFSCNRKKIQSRNYLIMPYNVKGKLPHRFFFNNCGQILVTAGCSINHIVHYNNAGLAIYIQNRCSDVCLVLTL